MTRSIFILAACISLQWSSGQSYNAGTVFTNYTNLNPDTLLHYTYNPFTHQVYDLDIFNSSPEIEFVADGSSSPGGSSAYISIRSLSANVYINMGRLDSVYDSTSSSWLVTKVAKPLNAGDPINAAGTSWDNNMLYINDHSASFGWTKNVNDWIGADKYVGLKYDNGMSVAYGWMRMGCISKDSCYVKEFSSTALLNSIKQSHDFDLVVSPNPVNDKVFISSHACSCVIETGILSYNGQCLLRKAGTNAVREEIDMRSLPAGLYFLQVITSSGTRTCKVIKE